MQERLKMYDEELVKEIMISTALCVQELLMDDPQAAQDDIFDFVETMRWREANLLAGGMVLFAFAVILSMILLEKRFARAGA